ncbi:hypothetical protein DMUE_2211, partial [Dictyocoela muelleri]
VRSHRGRSPSDAIWALTFADCSVTPARGYAEIIESRNSNTIIPIIERIVRPGSIIYTDEWPAYTNLSNLNTYIHGTVCHKYHFVDPETFIHTQNVESFNNKIKYEIKKTRYKK